ncbi:hypothetical protein RCL1_007656 [Eukaryota sp. TZLM3-RCL]
MNANTCGSKSASKCANCPSRNQCSSNMSVGTVGSKLVINPVSDIGTAFPQVNFVAPSGGCCRQQARPTGGCGNCACRR